MQNLIGMELENAVKILEEEGFSCTVSEYRARRPMESDSERVLCVKYKDKQAELIVSRFKTNV